MEKSNNLTEFMAKYGVSLNDYNTNFGGLVGEFKIPPSILSFNSTLADDKDQVFNLLAYSIFNAINAMVNNRLLSYQQSNYDNWQLIVGGLRAENLKSAIYEEIKYRSLSNYFPELNNRQFILPSGVNLSANNAETGNGLNSLINPLSAELIANSHWEDLPEKKDDFFKNLLNKFANLNLSNVVVDTSFAGKFLKIKNDGSLSYDNGISADPNWGEIKGDIENQLDLKSKFDSFNDSVNSVKTAQELINNNLNNEISNLTTAQSAVNSKILAFETLLKNNYTIKKFAFNLQNKVRAWFMNPFPKQSGFQGSSDWYLAPSYSYVSFTDWRNNFGFNEDQKKEFQKAMDNAISSFVNPSGSGGANLWHQLQNIRFSDNGNDLETTFWPRTDWWASDGRINTITFYYVIYYLDKASSTDVPSSTDNSQPPPLNSTTLNDGITPEILAHNEAEEAKVNEAKEAMAQGKQYDPTSGTWY